MSIERATISDREWALICPELSTLPHIKIGNIDKCRKFIGAVCGSYEEAWSGVCYHLSRENGYWAITILYQEKAGRNAHVFLSLLAKPSI